MNGELDIMIVEDHKVLLGKWLKILLYMKLVDLGNLLFGLLPFGDDLVRLISLAINGACVYVLVQLSPACKRYRTVAILNGVLLAGSLLSLGMLTLIFSVCGIVADYQEYAGHGDVVDALDGKLAGKWRFLFWLEVIVTMVGAVAMSVGLVIASLSGVEVPAQTDTAMFLSTATELLVRMIYLVYLNKTVKHFME